jgi:hypothetical protein
MNFPNAVPKVAIIANRDANADDSEILFDFVRMWNGIQILVRPLWSYTSSIVALDIELENVSAP